MLLWKFLGSFWCSRPSLAAAGNSGATRGRARRWVNQVFKSHPRIMLIETSGLIAKMQRMPTEGILREDQTASSTMQILKLHLFFDSTSCLAPPMPAHLANSTGVITEAGNRRHGIVEFECIADWCRPK